MSKPAITLKRAKEENIKTIELKDENGNIVDILEFSPTHPKTLLAMAQFAKLEPELKSRRTPEKLESVILGIMNVVDTLFGPGTFDYLVLDPSEEEDDLDMFDNINMVMEEVFKISKKSYKKKDKELEKYVLKEEETAW